MRLIRKSLLILLLLIIAGVSALIGYLKFYLPNVGAAPDLMIEKTPERVERGKYLAHHVMMCMDCHSPRNWNKLSGPVDHGYFAGGEAFGRNRGFPGEFIPGNLTPAGIGDWTDGELFRAVTSGVSRDGRALFPIMPYDNFSKLDREDIYAVIAYLRTLKSIEHDEPKSSADFPMNLLINTMPREALFSKRPSPDDTIDYGRYMTLAAGCNHCHTPMKKGRFIENMDFAGGMEFPLPTGGIVRSSNITPDPATGIGSWSADSFVRRFKSFHPDSIDKNSASIEPGGFNTEMPWTAYAGMTDGDMKAIHSYLLTLKPIRNKIIRFTP
ncbi:MAG: c-type cytochrome [Bacteroidales bacterium]|nr:c-type cytochrome [Bacteroidales bacterium]